MAVATEKKKKTGPTKKTPEDWVKTGINLCSKQNKRCKRLVNNDSTLNRDIIIHKALKMFFESKKT